VRGPWSRVYCGGGRLKRCRAAILGSLASALTAKPADLYGRGDCTSGPDAECYDENRWVEAAAVTIPPMPFQNRPTFQQVAEIPEAAASLGLSKPAQPLRHPGQRGGRSPGSVRLHRYR
jgi:hypothetical protein